MTTPFPAPDTRYPLILPDGTPHKGSVFLKAVIDHPNWRIGNYSYAFSFDPPDDWAAHLAPWLYPGAPERLHIGKFCQIADGVQIITASANHRRDGISTFPFAIFSGFGDRPSLPDVTPENFPDTRIGHDVWIGAGAVILPGADIGSGTIIGARSVVSGQIPPYSIVAGNPGRVVRQRFPDAVSARLVEIAWWDWPIAAIMAEESEICGGDVDALAAVAIQPGRD